MSYLHIHLFSNVLHRRRRVSPRRPGAVSVVGVALLDECGGIQRRALVASVGHYFFDRRKKCGVVCIFSVFQTGVGVRA